MKNRTRRNLFAFNRQQQSARDRPPAEPTVNVAVGPGQDPEMAAAWALFLDSLKPPNQRQFVHEPLRRRRP